MSGVGPFRWRPTPQALARQSPDHGVNQAAMAGVCVRFAGRGRGGKCILVEMMEQFTGSMSSKGGLNQTNVGPTVEGSVSAITEDHRGSPVTGHGSRVGTSDSAWISALEVAAARPATLGSPTGAIWPSSFGSLSG